MFSDIADCQQVQTLVKHLLPAYRKVREVFNSLAFFSDRADILFLVVRRTSCLPCVFLIR